MVPKLAYQAYVMSLGIGGLTLSIIYEKGVELAILLALFTSCESIKIFLRYKSRKIKTGPLLR